jgi:hypothetical protein
VAGATNQLMMLVHRLRLSRSRMMAVLVNRKEIVGVSKILGLNNRNNHKMIHGVTKEEILAVVMEAVMVSTSMISSSLCHLPFPSYSFSIAQHI